VSGEFHVSARLRRLSIGPLIDAAIDHGLYTDRAGTGGDFLVFTCAPDPSPIPRTPARCSTQ
jgi:hypothetical protein